MKTTMPIAILSCLLATLASAGEPLATWKEAAGILPADHKMEHDGPDQQRLVWRLARDQVEVSIAFIGPAAGVEAATATVLMYAADPAALRRVQDSLAQISAVVTPAAHREAAAAWIRAHLGPGGNTEIGGRRYQIFANAKHARILRITAAPDVMTP